MKWHGFQIVENKDVPSGTAWLVSPPRDPRDTRPVTERIFRVVNFAPPPKAIEEEE